MPDVVQGVPIATRMSLTLFLQRISDSWVPVARYIRTNEWKSICRNFYPFHDSVQLIAIVCHRIVIRWPFIWNIFIPRADIDNLANVFIVATIVRGRDNACWGKRRRLLPFDYEESRAEISAPQFGDNRIPPLHTILGVTVRYNTWHHVFHLANQDSLLNRWPFIFFPHILLFIFYCRHRVLRDSKKHRLCPSSFYPVTRCSSRNSRSPQKSREGREAISFASFLQVGSNVT